MTPSAQRVDGELPLAGQTAGAALAAAPAGAVRYPDLTSVLVLAALPLLGSLLLPWVLLRPNRIAPGEFQGLPLPWALLGGLLALALPLSARSFPRLLGLLASGCAGLGLWWLGSRTSAALVGQLPFARASASSGLWLWLGGAALAVYGARLAAPGRAGRLLALLWLPLLLWLALSGSLNDWSVVREGLIERQRWVQELLQHLRLIGAALLLSVLIGGPLAVWAARRAGVAGVVLGLAGAVQTVPSLALLGLLIAPLAALSTALPGLRALGISGIGQAPALTAMTLYALLPVLRNGVVALRGVAPGALDAATGMGMTTAQRFWRVQLPLALPVWLSGVRQAAVLLVGVAAIAALIGAGGLGVYIFRGFQSGAADLILLGALPAVLLAVLLNAALRALEGWLARRW